MPYLNQFWLWIVDNIFEVSILLTLWGHFYTLKRNQYSVAYKKKEEASNLIEGNIEQVRRLQEEYMEKMKEAEKTYSSYDEKKKRSSLHQEKIINGIHRILREWNHVCRRIQSELVHEELLKQYMSSIFIEFIKDNHSFVDMKEEYKYIMLVYKKWELNN